MIDKAIHFAASAHAGQLRKGSELPYILHPVEAGVIVSHMTKDSELISAAILHDVLEDTEATYEQLVQEFGSRVAELVASETEDKSKTWRERKSHTLEQLRQHWCEESAIVMLGDKLSNIRAMHRDLKEVGDRLWDRFHVKDSKLQQWYYEGLVETLKPLAGRDSYGEFKQLVAEVFSGKTVEEPVIRSGIKPGDIGELIRLHGWIYATECGYNHEFEGYVCKTFYQFLEQYSEDKDRLWFVEVGDRMVGAIGIVAHTSDTAQLRWFLLHPDYRGLGLGKRLVNEALQFCNEKGYQHVFLETTDDQQQAIRMYEKVGFKHTKSRNSEMWGKSLVEMTFELHR